MNRHFLRVIGLTGILVLLSVTVLEVDAFARAGGGRSSGSRGTRSYTSPSRPSPSPSPSRQTTLPSPSQPASPVQPGGFLRGIGGGILGGLLGGMLFRSLGFGAGNGIGGSGIGLFEILLLVAGGYILYRVISKRRRTADSSYQSPFEQRIGVPDKNISSQPYGERVQDIDQGMSHVRQMDTSFDEGRFKDTAMDIFFKIQASWMNRNLSPVREFLTNEMRSILQADIDNLMKEKKVNKLENIAVRDVDITEVWQESGQDFITVRFYANLLDYTVDEATGKVLSGSTTEPVKFEEYWTFTRAVGNNPWGLSAITQA